MDAKAKAIRSGERYTMAHTTWQLALAAWAVTKVWKETEVMRAYRRTERMRDVVRLRIAGL